VRLDGEAWRAFFDGYDRDAFRLETLPVYDVAGERDEFALWTETGRVFVDPDDPWLVRVRNFRSTGRTIGRVHVVTRPLSDYLRYEFAFYEHTVQAGEDVRILDASDHPDHGISHQDFWIFDESAVVRMEYDISGRQIGREFLEGVDPAPYVEQKRRALDLAVPFLDYKARLEG
jgi:hypothetical protein